MVLPFQNRSHLQFTMQLKYNQMENNYLIQILTVIVCVVFASLCDGCHNDPVILNEDFFVCCKGLPHYSSEYCIDVLLENSTFSQECMVDCLYREYQMYDGETFDLATVKTFLDSHITNVEFNLVYANAFERCSKWEKSSIEQLFSFVNITNIHDCDVYPSYVDICIWYFTLANCPDTYATGDETCNDKREWVKECLL